MKKNTNKVLKVTQTGARLLSAPLYNKGTAFTEKERHDLGLSGLLPPHIETIEEQSIRCYQAFQQKDDDIQRHIYLRALQDRNETLFYHVLRKHLTEMMPIIYTPVVGMACQQFSHIYRRPRGLFISYPHRNNLDEVLQNSPVADVQVIVVTDGERILGLGDQGAGGMGIPIGKLSLYTACAGINPTNTLPILLDVGTNNTALHKDPSYIGWRHERITGVAYDAFLEQFVSAVERNFPNVLLQFEDFAQQHASALLARYRDRLCTFNDDIQGTAAVAVGTILAACKVAGTSIKDQQVAVLGAGSAGCGISEQIIRAMVADGLSEEAARRRFYLVDREGLLHDDMHHLLPFQQNLAQPKAALDQWQSDTGQFNLADVVRYAQPTLLIGVSGQSGLFTESIIRDMAAQVDRPIIFPMSNPTSRSEAVPEDLIKWTDGRALIATGSPFADVNYQGRTYPIAQGNNSYIFPAMGLGVLAAQARRVSDGMFMAAAKALSEQAPALKAKDGALLPDLASIHEVSQHIAYAVGQQAQQEGLAPQMSEETLKQQLQEKNWCPMYHLMSLQ